MLVFSVFIKINLQLKQDMILRKFIFIFRFSLMAFLLEYNSFCKRFHEEFHDLFVFHSSFGDLQSKKLKS